jgi:basic membrane protein A and related proteins
MMPAPATSQVHLSCGRCYVCIVRGSGGLLVIAIVLLASIGSAGASTGADNARRVVVVLDPGGCPDARTLRLCEGFERASRQTGVAGHIFTPTFREDLADVLGLLARQQYGAIILWSLSNTPALRAVATRYPGTNFVVLDGSRTDVRGRPRNVQGIVFRTSEAAFLAGWLAGKLEQRRPGRDVVGIVGGSDVPSVRDFVVGFRAGARRAAPGVEVMVDYSDDFVDASKCAAIARRQVARGAGTLFNVAAECGLGTMQVAADSGVWAVGVDSDQSSLGPHVLTSVLRRFDTGFATVLGQVKAGRVVTGQDTVLGLPEGAVGLGRISPKVPRSIVARLDGVRRDVLAGRIRVPSAYPRAPG